MQKQVTKSDYKGKDIFVGIDTHKKSWNITIMIGVYTKTFNAPPSAEELRNYLEKTFPGVIIIAHMKLDFQVFGFIISSWNMALIPSL